MSSSIIMIQSIDKRMFAHTQPTVAYNFFHCLVCCAKSSCNSSGNLLSRNEEKTVLFDFLCAILNVELPSEYSWDFTQEQNFPLCLRCTCVIKDMFQMQPAEDSIRLEMEKKVEKIRQTISDSVQSRKINSSLTVEDDRCEYFRNQVMKKNFEKPASPTLISNSKILVESNFSNEISKERAYTSKDVHPIAKRKRKRKVTKKKAVDDIIRYSENNARTPSSPDTCHIQFHTPLNSEDLAKIVSTIVPVNFPPSNNICDSDHDNSKNNNNPPTNDDQMSVVENPPDINDEISISVTGNSPDTNHEMSVADSPEDIEISNDLFFPESPWSNWDDWENIILPLPTDEIYEGDDDDSLYQELIKETDNDDIENLLDPANLFSCTCTNCKCETLDYFTTLHFDSTQSENGDEDTGAFSCSITDCNCESSGCFKEISDSTQSENGDETTDMCDSSTNFNCETENIEENTDAFINLFANCDDESSDYFRDVFDSPQGEYGDETTDMCQSSTHFDCESSENLEKQSDSIQNGDRTTDNVSHSSTNVDSESSDCLKELSNSTLSENGDKTTDPCHSQKEKDLEVKGDETIDPCHSEKEVEVNADKPSDPCHSKKGAEKEVEVITLDDDDNENPESDDDSCTIIEMNSNHKKSVKTKSPLKNVKTRTRSISSSGSESNGKIHIVLTTHSYITDPIYPDGSTNVIIEQKTPIQVKGGIFMAVAGAHDTWQCILCGKIVKNFKNHKAVHFPGQFKCSLCPAVFRRKDNLNAHLRSKH